MSGKGTTQKFALKKQLSDPSIKKNINNLYMLYGRCCRITVKKSIEWYKVGSSGMTSRAASGAGSDTDLSPPAHLLARLRQGTKNPLSRGLDGKALPQGGSEARPPSATKDQTSTKEDMCIGRGCNVIPDWFCPALFAPSPYFFLSRALSLAHKGYCSMERTLR